jgi:hypothetical protein
MMLFSFLFAAEGGVGQPPEDRQPTADDCRPNGPHAVGRRTQPAGSGHDLVKNTTPVAFRPSAVKGGQCYMHAESGSGGTTGAA